MTNLRRLALVATALALCCGVAKADGPSSSSGVGVVNGRSGYAIKLAAPDVGALMCPGTCAPREAWLAQLETLVPGATQDLQTSISDGPTGPLARGMRSDQMIAGSPLATFIQGRYGLTGVQMDQLFSAAGAVVTNAGQFVQQVNPTPAQIGALGATQPLQTPLTPGFLGLTAARPTTATPAYFTGPLISAAIPEQARYAPGSIAHVAVVLTNGTGAPWSGLIGGVLTGRGVVTGAQPVVTVAALAVGASTTLDMVFNLPDGQDGHGYLASFTAYSALGGPATDTAATALDSSSDYAPYPRECFVTQFTAGTDTAALTRGLRAFQCNVLQFYDVNYKHQTPYNPGLSWPNLAGTTVDAATVRAYIANAHQGKQAVFNYSLWNGAYANFQTDGTGALLAWGQFSTNCSPGCTLASLDATPSNGAAGGTSLFPAGWMTPYLVEMDPTNPAWTAYWTSANAPLIQQFGYDGLQIDTLGNPGTRYNATGAINFSGSLAGFVNYARTKIGTRGVINNVSRWDEASVVGSAEDFYYSELHPEFGDTATYPAINGAVAAVRGVSATKGIDHAMYMDSAYGLTPSCTSAGGATPCYFNLPGLLYAEAQFIASGADHVWLADGDRGVSNIFIPGPQLGFTAATRQAVLEDRTFEVAYEKILRSGVSDAAAQPASMTATVGAGCGSSSSGAAGGIYMIPKARAGLQIVQMLNFCGLTSINPQDTNGTQPGPTTISGVQIKFYYTGAVTGSNRLWVASPDINHGAAQSIAFTKGSDGTGTYITATVPSLKYYDLLWLELDALSSSDYATP